MMLKNRKLIVLLVIYTALIIISCGPSSLENETNTTPINQIKNDSLIFTTHFQPSFSEESLIKFTKFDSSQELQILIKNNYRIDESEDTFYYKKISLSQNQFIKIDTSLLQKMKIKYLEKHSVGFDGMSIFFHLIEKGDTTRIGFWSPTKQRDLFGYELTQNAIDIFKSFFNDPIITDYLDDIETYIDESKISVLSKKNRAINKLRQVKYSR